jgi:hypothetical protein
MYEVQHKLLFRHESFQRGPTFKIQYENITSQHQMLQ